jgi:hypothetical protein
MPGAWNLEFFNGAGYFFSKSGLIVRCGTFRHPEIRLFLTLMKNNYDQIRS